MPIKPCRECKKDVSTEAAACPHCGASTPAQLKSPDSVPCTKCGSTDTTRLQGLGPMGLLSLITGSCMLWIPIIGWVLAPVFFLLTVLFWVLALIPTGRIFL